MKKQNRKAFTIVELVIVIAVIGILAAVLIPTFSGIIKSANISSDQTTAATLTTELRLADVGKDITNEAELMKAIESIDGFKDKLVPKALNYGYHFWFDMATQTIIVETSEEIEKKPASTPVAYNSDSETEDEGVVPASVELIDDDNEESNSNPLAINSSFLSFRDIHNNGYYLIDSAEVINKVFGLADDIKDGNSYKAFIESLNDAKDDKIYGIVATALSTKLPQITIRNEYGIFHYAGATGNYEYFAYGVQVLTSTRYVYDNGEVKTVGVDGYTADVPAPKGNVVNLPSSVLLVEANALNYTDTSVNIVLNTLAGTDYSNITNIFAPKSTNAVIVDTAGRQFNVTVADGANHKDGDSVIAKDTDILVENNEFRAYLVPKAPLVEWNIGYSLSDTTITNSEPWLKLNDNTLYVYFASGVDFYIKDAAGNRSDAVLGWTSTNDNIAKVEDGKLVINGEGEITITANVKDLNNDVKTKSIDVVVVKPQSATVRIDGNNYTITDGESYDIEWYYNGTNDLPTVLYKGDNNEGTGIDFGYNFAHGGQKLTIEIVETAEGESMFQLNSDKNGIAMKTDGNGKVIGTGETTFKLSIDGCLETTFTVTVINNSASPLQVGFHDKSEDPVYKYYIGDNNGVALGDLFDLKTGKSFANAILTVYDQKLSYNDYWDANLTEQGVTVTLGEKLDYADYDEDKYTAWTLTSGWDEQVLDFSDVTEETTVWIKIAPENDSAIFIEFTVVDATNVDDLNALKSTDKDGKVTSDAITLSNNVVLHDDCEIKTGTTVDVGAKTLYGNGYVINAKGYEASDVLGQDTKTIDWCRKDKRPWSECDHSTNLYKTTQDYTYDYYSTDVNMISLSGGTIDNIYINGPVYPDLQYNNDDCTIEGHDAHVYSPYYVSGIKATGNATIRNSFVSGFRQPVQVKNTGTDKVSVKNTTLHGGNYANLEIVDGDLYLYNVTTIQEQEGSKPTVGDNSKNVIGLGIVRGDASLNNTLTIDGYLDQYNWISSAIVNNNIIKLPVLNVNGATLDTKVLFNGVFNGYKVEDVLGFIGVNAIGEAGSVKAAIVQDSEQANADYVNHNDETVKGSMNPSVGYVNVGIVFAYVGPNNTTYTNPVTTGRVAGKLPLRAMDASPVVDTVFSKVGMEGVLTAADEFGTDGRLILWGTRDWRVWSAAPIDTTSMSTIIDSIKGLDGEWINYKYYFKRWARPVDENGDNIADIADDKTTYTINKAKELNYDGYYYHDDTDNTKDSPYNNIFKPVTSN